MFNDEELAVLKQIASGLDKIAAVQTQLLGIALESRQTRMNMEAKMKEMLKNQPLEK